MREPTCFFFGVLMAETLHIPPRIDILHDKLIVPELVRMLCIWFRTQCFSVMFSSQTMDPFLSIIKSIYSHHIFLRLVLVLFFHLHLDLSNGFLFWSFQTKVSYAFLIFLLCAVCPVNFLFLDFITTKCVFRLYEIFSSLVFHPVYRVQVMLSFWYLRLSRRWILGFRP
jgi:hypothetical protein